MSDFRNIQIGSVEDEQVAFLHFMKGNFAAEIQKIFGRTRNAVTETAVYKIDEPGTVETNRRISSAINIRCSKVLSG